ncbi:glycosyltransferase [Blautia wexlerae]|uniref:Glycosyltransferase n=1 Tax=Blautia wexlerae TaxID=418240 RepID=A0ABX2GSI6_9FIRM|nr:glycosyltransferase [Blautia wexlerae]NSF75118.1 glycosyltransferase [Blautia wexlerae]
MINKKYVILGVAFEWEERKGLDVFIDLAKCLNEEYQIILVGTDDRVDKLLPENIMSIHRTHNQKELVEIYSVADLFLNPTREENYPTVNIEALACGTPVLTFNTGGSPEIIDENCGEVIYSGEIMEVASQIEHICKKEKYKSVDCIRRASTLEREMKFLEYINLYQDICGGNG